MVLTILAVIAALALITCAIFGSGILIVEWLSRRDKRPTEKIDRRKPPKLVSVSEPEVVPLFSRHFVPMSVREAEDAEMERQIRAHMDSVPKRGERILFAVSDTPSNVLQFAPRSGDAA